MTDPKSDPLEVARRRRAVDARQRAYDLVNALLCPRCEQSRVDGGCPCEQWPGRTARDAA